MIPVLFVASAITALPLKFFLFKAVFPGNMRKGACVFSEELKTIGITPAGTPLYVAWTKLLRTFCCISSWFNGTVASGCELPSPEN